MSVLIAGAGLFAFAFVIHVVIWRFRVPRHQALAVVLLFLAVGLIGLSAFAGFGLDALHLTPLRLVLAIILFGSFGVSYLILFSALEADSPTMTIIGLITANGDRGICREELSEAMANHSFVQLRLNQMLHDGMAYRSGDRLLPGAQGLFLTKLILWYRRLLGREHIGG
jgi:hypothetical protein